MVVKNIYILIILFILTACKSTAQNDIKINTPGMFKKFYSKLHNKPGDIINTPVIYKYIKIENYNSETDAYLEIKMSEEYERYLVLLENGRCFTNTLLKGQNISENVMKGNLISVGYYRIINSVIEVEIYGNTSGGFFGYSKGTITNNNITLYSKESYQIKPRYIEYLQITSSIFNEDNFKVNW